VDIPRKQGTLENLGSGYFCVAMLTKDELAEVVTNCDHLQNFKFRPSLPYAFTEQGVAMLAAVTSCKFLSFTVLYIVWKQYLG